MSFNVKLTKELKLKYLPASLEDILLLPQFDIIDWQKLPRKPGVYFLVRDLKYVVYIGKTKNLRGRFHSYTHQYTIDVFPSILHFQEFIPKHSLLMHPIEKMAITNFMPCYNVIT